FYHINPVRKDQRQPMGITVFAMFESHATDHSAQTRRWRCSSKHGSQVRPLVGMKNFHLMGRLLYRALPVQAVVVVSGISLHGIGGLIFWISIHSPAFYMRIFFF